MDEFNFKGFGDMGQNSVIGLLVIPWLRVAWKKYISGDFVSYKTLKENQDKMDAKLNGHLELEAKEDIMFSELRSDHANLKNMVATENGHIFSQLATIHQKLDDLMKIMIQQKDR